MTTRDVERTMSRGKLVSALGRLADALEAGAPLHIQVADKRSLGPADAETPIEHEVKDGTEELELQLRWRKEARRGGPAARKRR